MRTWLVLAVILTGCSRDDARPVSEPSHSDNQLVEWIQVDGSCKEDHTAIGGHYSGDLVHWRNKITGDSKRYGSVTYFDSLDPKVMMEKVEHPNRYQPPFIIAFENVTAADFAAQASVLHGVSEADKGGGYDATCELAVTRRLDHLPSDAERKAWAKSANEISNKSQGSSGSQPP